MNKRFREYGFDPGLLDPGTNNSITDVEGVLVGHFTKKEGKNIRTGITLIDPGVDNLYGKKLPAAISVGNGFGKLAGITQVEELGTMEAPIALTNTLAVGPVMRGVVDHVIKTTDDLQPVETINAIVGETNDGMLNQIHLNSLSSDDVKKVSSTLSSKVEMGCVGAGTGTRCFSWKGGIGTASRKLTVDGKEYVLGALVQTNYGGNLTIMGVEIGKRLGKTDFDSFLPAGDGSCMIVFATNAPLSARQLKRIASRAFIGLGRTGSVLANGSGDYAIAFSTNRSQIEGSEITDQGIKDKDLTQFFLAAAETTEESVYDALFAAETTTGRDGTTLEALPKDNVVEILKFHLNEKSA